MSVESLAWMLETEVQEGITEMSCHPGYVDPAHRSSYSAPRATELRTLCDPRVRDVIHEGGIILVGYADLARIQLQRHSLTRLARSPLQAPRAALASPTSSG